MKKAIIIHGWDGYPEEGWFPWLKGELEERGYVVEVPEMPEPGVPTIDAWIGKVRDVTGEPDGETLLVGHSIGCQAILRFLESSAGVAHRVILVAPWMHLDENTIREEEGVEEIAMPWMETPISWKDVRNKASGFVAIFSDDDPYVPLTEKDLFGEKLGAEVAVEHGMGHFSGGDGIRELPVVLEKL